MQGRREAVGVIGAGGVGTILAAFLTRAGRDVVLVENGPRLERIRRDGLRVQGAMELSVQPAFVLGSMDDLAHVPVHLAACLLCTKAWALRSLSSALRAVLGAEATVVCCQNGIGLEDRLLPAFAREQLARGIMNFGGMVDSGSSTVTMPWFNAPNYLGGADDSEPARSVLRELAQDFSRAGLTTELVPSSELRRMELLKAILNSALNALCALCGITMRQAMTYPHTCALARRLIREGLSVAAALGYAYGDDPEQDCLRYLDRGGDHFPSMWYDLEQGSPTEIEFINGKMVELGLAHGLTDVEVNRVLTSLVLTREIRSGARRPDDIPAYLTPT